MSNIKTFIQNRMQDRIKQNGVLVVYDPHFRYRDLCLELEKDEVRVVDASESSIESREAALQALTELGQVNPSLKGLLVYVPAKAPLNDEEKQRDPFTVFAVCGHVFPEGDSDEFINLCLMAKPDYATNIRRIFGENQNPDFAVIDAVGGGKGWPNLQAILRVESAQEILFALLSPSELQGKALKNQDTWVSEAKELFKIILGLNLVARSKSWGPIADELWRFLLFSEFVFDLPEEVPESLSIVPRSNPEARTLVGEICNRLRNDRRTQATYIERAENIEKELDLPAHCAGIEDLGVRDTFPFEERSFFRQAIECLKRGDTDTVRNTLNRRKSSVWTGKGESQIQWAVVRAALHLIDACDDYERQLCELARSMEALIDYYTGSLREVDRLHREFEQSVSDYIDVIIDMGEVVDLVRNRYQRLTGIVQDIFIRHLEQTGWPAAGRLSNSDLFDSLVAPKLQTSGHRVALLLVDALRYELGVELEKQLSEDGQAEIKASFAQLPSITTVGMASLLPEAGQQLLLKKNDNGNLVPMIGDTPVTNVSQRMAVLQKRYGQRFAESTLKDFIRGNCSPANTVDLLVIRSDNIDAQLEADPEAALGRLHDTLKRIRVAVNKLKGLGFHEVVIVTDHGFVLNTHAKAGDVCSKPQGEWINLHERCLIGKGSEDAANLVVPAEHVGIRGDFEFVAVPRALVSYRAGVLYFHGGASLQECVVPVITMRLGLIKPDYRKPTVRLSYKNGAKSITTRLPVIDLAVDQDDMFALGSDLEILIEAQDKNSNIVGESKTGGRVNPATGTLMLKPGEQVPVILKMQSEYEGKFTVKAMNPITLTVYCSINLETDYVV